MKKTIKTITAFLTAITMTAGAMGVTAFAEETVNNTELIAPQAEEYSENNDFAKIVENKGKEMKQYLLDNGISEEIADEVTAYYLEGYRKRALPDGTDRNPTNAKFHINCALDLAKCKMGIATGNYDDNAISRFFSENGIYDEDHQRFLNHIKGETQILKSNLTIVDEETRKKEKETLKQSIKNSDSKIEEAVPALIKGIQAGTDATSNIKGDANADGVLDIRDTSFIHDALESGENIELPLQADFNEDGVVDIRDISAIMDSLKADNQNDSKQQVETQAATEVEAAETNKQVEKTPETINKTEKNTVSTIKGDVDLNGEVGIADVVKVSKNNINEADYPLENEIAEANADMNDDNVIDGLDTAALIEINLGNKK